MDASVYVDANVHVNARNFSFKEKNSSQILGKFQQGAWCVCELCVHSFALVSLYNIEPSVRFFACVSLYNAEPSLRFCALVSLYNVEPSIRFFALVTL